MNNKKLFNNLKKMDIVYIKKNWCKKLDKAFFFQLLKY